MEDRLAVISCIISDPQSVSVMNEKLHLHASMIIARLGVPCRGIRCIRSQCCAPWDPE